MAATTIRFVTDWKAQAEHGGFYQALADGLYAKRGLDVKIIQGGPDVNVPQLLAGGAADFGMGSNSFICLNMVKTGVPIRAVMAIFQKDPQVLISHPRRDINSLADMRGKPILISAATMSAFWPWLRAKFGFSDTPDPQIHLQPGAVHPRSQRHPGRLSHQRALHGAATGAFHAQDFPALRLRLSRLCQHGAGAAEMDRHQPQGGAGCSWTPPATAGCTICDNPAKGNALIKRDNPDMTDAILAPGAGQDETAMNCCSAATAAPLAWAA